MIETCLQARKFSKSKKILMFLLRCRKLTKPFQKLSTERTETCNNRTEAILMVTLKFNNIIKHYLLNYPETKNLFFTYI